MDSSPMTQATSGSLQITRATSGSSIRKPELSRSSKSTTRAGKIRTRRSLLPMGGCGSRYNRETSSECSIRRAAGSSWQMCRRRTHSHTASCSTAWERRIFASSGRTRSRGLIRPPCRCMSTFCLRARARAGCEWRTTPRSTTPISSAATWVGSISRPVQYENGPLQAGRNRAPTVSRSPVTASCGTASRA